MASEARHAPRFSRQLNVDINGLDIVTTNIARGGVQLCCPQMRYHGFLRAAKDGVIRLKIRLPDSSNWLTLSGSVRYVNPSKNDYLIGVQISDIDPETEIQWAAYIGILAESESKSTE